MHFSRTNPEYQLTQALEGRIERGSEDDILRVENFLPGLGGIYVDRGNLVAFVPPEMSRQDALAKLALGAMVLNLDPTTRQQMITGQRIILRPAKFAFSRLVSWVEAGVGGAMRVPGVTGVDANEMTNRITVFVSSESAGPAAIAKARAAGLPDGAIEISVVPIARLADGLRGTFYFPAGGVQISNEADKICTLGYDDDYEEIAGFWTAAHCSKYSYTEDQTSLGEHFYQPTYYGGSVGTSVMRATQTGVTDTLCGSAVLCAHVDGMYVAYDTPGRMVKKVARLDGLTAVAPDTTPVIGDIAAYWTNINMSVTGSSFFAGLPIDKVARSTGWSRGKLTNTCVPRTFNVGVSGYLTETILCTDVVSVDSVSSSVVNIPFAGSGDSGGPVFISNNDASTELKAMGIIIGVTVPPNAAYYENAAYMCMIDQCQFFVNRLARLKLWLHTPY